MELLIGTTIIIVLIAILLLGIRVFFTKNGKFPNTHIGNSKATANVNRLRHIAR